MDLRVISGGSLMVHRRRVRHREGMATSTTLADRRQTAPVPPPPAPNATPTSDSPEPPRVRRRRWWFRLFAVAVVGGSLAFDQSPIVLVALLFVLIVPFERIFPRHDQPLRRRHLSLDIAYALSQPALGVVTLAVGVVIGVASMVWLPALLLRPLVAGLSPLAQTLIGFALFDLIIYWVHRWSHEVPFLWRFHSIHHSIETMDWISAFRNHPIDGFILAPPIVFLLSAGFSLELTGALAAIQIVIGLFLHANVRWRWRPIQRLLITPDFHHWHHANEADAISSNYSVFFPAWDMAFGTWFMPPDRRPSIYGVDEVVPTSMAAQMAYPFRGLRPVPIVAKASLRHPIRSVRELAQSMGRGLAQMRLSARRPRRPFRTPPSAPPRAPNNPQPVQRNVTISHCSSPQEVTSE